MVFQQDRKKKNYYLKKCNFLNLTTDGAVRFDSENESIMLVEDTAFSYCRDNFNHFGGSLYYRSTGHFIQDRVCYYQSIHNRGRGVSFSLELPSNETSKLYLNQSSVSSCGVNSKTAQVNVYIEKGYEIISNYNITNNVCERFGSYSHKFVNNDKVILKFLNVRNNSNTNYGLFGPKAFHTADVKFTSIVENELFNIMNGVIQGRHNLTLYNCSICRNKANILFELELELDDILDILPVVLFSCYFDSNRCENCTLESHDAIESDFDITYKFIQRKLCMVDQPTYVIERHYKIYSIFNFCYHASNID